MIELDNCAACGHQVSKTAKVCPQCGDTDPTRMTFSKVMALILAAVVGFGLFYIIFIA